MSFPRSTTRDMVLSIEDARLRGREMVQWLEDPTANDPPCPVSANTLTYRQLQELSDDVARATNARVRPHQQLPELEFPEGVQAPADYIRYYMTLGGDCYTLHFAPGVIVLSSIAHRIGSTGPHPSDIALTIYQEEFGHLHTLRYVFACTVINEQTIQRFYQDFERISGAEFGTPEMIHAHTYLYDTPEYEALLGVRIPRTVGYLVLGAFPRGHRRIARIRVYTSSQFSHDMRFDIEPLH